MGEYTWDLLHGNTNRLTIRNIHSSDAVLLPLSESVALFKIVDLAKINPTGACQITKNEQCFRNRHSEDPRISPVLHRELSP